MREDKRLKIARRQLVLAQIARREARFALANALAEEDRSGKVHTRAQSLLNEYAKRVAAGDGVGTSQTLQANLAFVRSLQVMADDAHGAHKDASDQAQWQMRTLAKAETRMETRETRVKEERRALADLQERRDFPAELMSPAGLARKLQNR